MLELVCPKSFHAWMRVRRLLSQHSTYPGLFFMACMRAKKARPIPELFNPDESKRAKKEARARPFLELFHIGRENPTDLAPTLDKTHEDSKNKSTASWRDITLKRLDMPTTVMAYIQHIAKENSKIQKITRTDSLE
jgi:hypothetical protein